MNEAELRARVAFLEQAIALAPDTVQTGLFHSCETRATVIEHGCGICGGPWNRATDTSKHETWCPRGARALKQQAKASRR